MRWNLPNEAVPQQSFRTLDHGFDREPPSPANLLACLGVLLLIALCFGFAARFLFGAP